MRRGMPLVRRQIHVEPQALSPDRRTDGDRPCYGMSCAGDRHHGRRTAALSAGGADRNTARQGAGDIPRNVGDAPLLGVFRLGVPVAQAAATAAGRSVREGARTEGDRRGRGRFRMGRAQCRTGGSRVHPLPATRVERCGTHDARDRRVCEGASEMEYLDPDS